MSSRLEFVSLARDGKLTMRELCRRFGVSPKTGYKWLSRYEAEGKPGLDDRSRRPRDSPLRTPEAIERKILALRRKHPAWGGRKLRRRLLNLGIRNVPSPSTITAILRRNGCLDLERSQQHTAFKRFVYPRPNDLWQMDFKGHFQAGAVRCHPLIVIDDHSRFALGVIACRNEQRLTVQDKLTKVFKRYGMPHCILADNGPTWSGNCARDLTRMDIWMIRLGIRLIHGRPRHPQTQGKGERFNRTLQVELLQGRIFKGIHSCQKAFDRWRDLYNFERPHEALNLEVPGKYYQPSPRLFPHRLPLPEYALTDEIRKVHDGGRIIFKNRKYRVGKALQGYSVAVRPTGQDGIYDVFFYAQRVKEIDLRRGKPVHGPNHKRNRR